jgi:hypothetical protein
MDVPLAFFLVNYGQEYGSKKDPFQHSLTVEIGDKRFAVSIGMVYVYGQNDMFDRLKLELKH